MQNDNPYASPLGVGVPPIVASETKSKPASTGIRFLNLFLDNIFVSIASNGIGFVYGVVYALGRVNPAIPLTPEEDLKLRLIGGALGIATVVAYYLIMEGLWQRTIAKLITGTRVVSAEGGVPTFGQIVGRTFARFIPFEAFSFFGGNGFPVGWHDSLSGTRVVKVN